MLTHQKNPNFSLPNIWSRRDERIHLASRCFLSRNLNTFCFPSKLDLNARAQIFNFLSKELTNRARRLARPCIYEGSRVSGEYKQWITEHFLLCTPINQTCGGEGFVLDKSGKVIILINCNDHLQIQATYPGDDLQGCFEKVIQLETKINSTVDFAYSDKFGFLTANPSQCGTALNISTLLHLPVLCLQKHWQHLDQQNIILSNIHGQIAKDIELKEKDLNFFTGGLVWVQNRFTLGKTEEQALSSVINQSLRFSLEEKQLRQSLNVHLPDFKNQVSRAYGLLKYSWSLETTELIQAAGILKLALDLALVKGSSHRQLNQLLFSCGRGFIEHETMGTAKDVNKTLEQLRGEKVHALLKRLRLNL